MESMPRVIRQWGAGQGTFLHPLTIAAVLGGLAIRILLHPEAPDGWDPAPGIALIGVMLFAYACWLVRWVRSFSLQLVAFAIPIAGLVGFFRGHASIDRELNIAAAVVLLGFAVFALATALRRLRTRLVLRLTETGIERGGYALPTPIIPYAAIAGADPFPAKDPKAVAITLRERRGVLAWTLFVLQAYDVKIGSDVYAPAVELADLIRREVPGLRDETVLRWRTSGELIAGRRGADEIGGDPSRSSA